jgi:LacI family transcriptional regulator
VLNGRPIKISEEKRAQILETARRMCYQTNRTPTSRLSRTRKIGVITPSVTNGFFSEALDGIEQRVASEGFTVLLGQTFNRRDAERDALRRLLDNHVDGLIISTADDTLFEDVDEPVVLFNSELPTLNYSQVTYNECKGAFLATKHLLALGHQKIACLAGDLKQHADGRLDSPRADGYFWAYADSDLPAPENSLFYGDYLDAQSGYEQLDSIMKGGFTALFSCNDLMAYGVYRRAAELKVRIPGDLSIVGFDDLSYSSLLTPALTTVRQSGARLGREAAERLLHELDEPGAPHQSIRFEPTLIVRDSTGAPHDAGKEKA